MLIAILVMAAKEALGGICSAVAPSAVPVLVTMASPDSLGLARPLVAAVAAQRQAHELGSCS